jgi:hypothetical protein
VDRPPVLDRLWDYLKFLATVDIAAIVGILTVYPNIGLVRSDALIIVVCLVVSLGACLWALHRLAFLAFSSSFGRLEWGCYWVAFYGLTVGIIALITTALVI